MVQMNPRVAVGLQVPPDCYRVVASKELLKVDAHGSEGQDGRVEPTTVRADCERRSIIVTSLA